MLGDLPPETIEVVRAALRSLRPFAARDQPVSPAPAARRDSLGRMASGRLFAGLFAHGETAAEVGDAALAEAMVEVEVALLQALADLDLAPRRGG